jgi:ribonucleoside-diphosphate reductase alpha chain
MTNKKARPQKLEGSTYQTTTGCGKLYVTINKLDDAAFEVFASMGKAGGCASSQIESIGRLISLGLRCGATPEQVIKQLAGISCHSPVFLSGAGLSEDNKIMSCADAIAKVIKDYISKVEE